MALSNAERQARYRQKIRTGELSRIDVKLPHEITIKLNYLVRHWQCSKAEALGRILMEAWEREGRPIPGYESEGESLSDNGRFQGQLQKSPQELVETDEAVPVISPAVHLPEASPQPAVARQRGPGPQTIARWKREAEKRVMDGLTAIMAHFSRHSRYEGMTYAGIRDLLSEADYEIACRVEIRRMRQEQGLSWTKIGKVLNEKGTPLPAGKGKGKWTGPKVKALMA